MNRDFYCTDTEPSVQTTAGCVHGYRFRNVYIFKGIPYAYADRFRAPVPPRKWEGLLDCFGWGFTCPNMSGTYGMNTELFVPRNNTPADEHCQYLNIWTTELPAENLQPELQAEDLQPEMPAEEWDVKAACAGAGAGRAKERAGGKADASLRPVMVWLHGGGYGVGAGNAHKAYDGENLSRYGDVVVVTLNHRLNWLGFWDVSSFGEEYAASANAGLSDIVAALVWIRDNITFFGGDPENVTLFGQSGGGMKALDLLQVSAADGLFRRIIVQSGVTAPPRRRTAEESRDLALRAMAHLHLITAGEDNEEALRQAFRQFAALPCETVSEALLEVTDGRAGGMMAFVPTPDDYFRGDVRDVSLPKAAREVDIMIGTVFAEFAVFPVPKTAPKAGMTWEEAVQKASELYSMTEQEAEALAALFRRAYPEKKPFDLLYVDDLFRLPTLEVTDILARESKGHIYNYLMAFDLPLGPGFPLRHSCDVPFVFHNTDMVPSCNAEDRTDRLEREISLAWASFARTGNPENENLPVWEAYTPDRRACMVFGDEESGVRLDHDRALVTAVTGHRAGAAVKTD